MRRAVLIAALLVGAAARADKLVTRFGFLGGFRANLGALGDRYAYGYLLGIEAGVQPGVLGLAWSLTRTQFFSSDPMNVDPRLNLWEMDFRLRARVGFRTAVPTFVYGQAGLELVRASIPIEPDDTRNYFGPSAGGGLELLAGQFLISLAGDYGLLVNGPSGAKVRK